MKSGYKKFIVVAIVIIAIALVTLRVRGMKGGAPQSRIPWMSEFTAGGAKYKVHRGHNIFDLELENETTGDVINVLRDRRTIFIGGFNGTPRTLSVNDLKKLSTVNLKPDNILLVMAHLWIQPDNSRLREYLRNADVPEAILDLFGDNPFDYADIYLSETPGVETPVVFISMPVESRIHKSDTEAIPRFSAYNTHDGNAYVAFDYDKGDGWLVQRREAIAKGDNKCESINDAVMFGIDYYLGLATSRKGCKMVK